MSDRFDHLSLPPADEGLDPAVRARVLADVRRLVGAASSIVERPGTESHFEHVEVVMNESPKPSRWRGVALVVTAVAAVAALIVFLVPRSGADDVESPAGGVDSTSVTTAATSSTAAPSTTTASVELTDEDIARAMVLTPSEYAPNWSSIGQNTNPNRLNGVTAATLAECAGFVDVAFEGPRRPATALWNTFTYGPPVETAVQYVVVFPDEAAAIAMFDAVNDPRFIDECRPAYTGPALQCCADSSVDVWPNPVGFVHEEGTFEHVGDQSTFTEREFTWTDENGELVGPETEYLALIRVGRSIIGIDSIALGREGIPVTSHEDFQKAMHNIVVRAEAALAGTPLPRA